MNTKSKIVKGLAGLLIGVGALTSVSGCATTDTNYDENISSVSTQNISQQDYENKYINNKILQSALEKVRFADPEAYISAKTNLKENYTLIQSNQFDKALDSYISLLSTLSTSLDQIYEKDSKNEFNQERANYIYYLVETASDLFKEKKYEQAIKVANIFGDTFSDNADMTSQRAISQVIAYSDYYLGNTQKKSEKINANLIDFQDDGSMGARMTLNINGQIKIIYFDRESTVTLNNEEELFKKGQKLQIWLDKSTLDNPLPYTTFLKVEK